jgi:serine/threonine protein kinase
MHTTALLWENKQDLARTFPTLEPMALDLLDRLFTYDPAVRITADEALRHPYLATATAASATVSATCSLSTAAAAAGDGYHCSDDMLSDDDVEDVYNSTPPLAAAAAAAVSTSSSSSGAARQRRAQQQRHGLSLLAAAFEASVSGDVTANVAVDPKESELLTPPISSEIDTAAAATAAAATPAGAGSSNSVSGPRQSSRRSSSSSSSARQTRTITAAAAAAQRSGSRAPAAAAVPGSNNINVRALLAPPAHLRVPEHCSEGAVRYLQHLYAMEARAARDRVLPAAASSSASGSSGGGGCALRPDHRGMLVDWIVEVIDVFEMCQRTAFLAVNYMDR